MFLQHISRWVLLGASAAEFESSIYPSAFRMRAFACLTLAFSLLMAGLHYFDDSGLGNGPALSLLLISASVLLLVQTYRPVLPLFSSAEIYSVLTWGTLSFCSPWFYFLTGYTHFQFVGLVLTTTTYFLITEIRHAILGTLGTALLCTLFFWWLDKSFPLPPINHILTMSLVYAGSIIFGFNNKRLRHLRINQTQALVRHMQRSLEPGLQGMNTLVPQLLHAADLLEGSPSAGRIEKIAKRLRRSSVSMQDYLDLQSINAQFLSLDTKQEALSAQALVREAVSGHPFMSHSNQSAVALRVVDDFYFCGSKQQWLHMLRNILHNAVQALYLEKDRLGAGDITITISCTPILGSISIRDRGRGIDPAHLQQIFHPFYTVDKSAGIGLGLSYCKQVVQASGGVISVVSGKEQGTRFAITLPRVEA